MNIMSYQCMNDEWNMPVECPQSINCVWHPYRKTGMPQCMAHVMSSLFAKCIGSEIKTGMPMCMPHIISSSESVYEVKGTNATMHGSIMGWFSFLIRKFACNNPIDEQECLGAWLPVRVFFYYYYYKCLSSVYKTGMPQGMALKMSFLNMCEWLKQSRVWMLTTLHGMWMNVTMLYKCVSIYLVSNSEQKEKYHSRIAQTSMNLSIARQLLNNNCGHEVSEDNHVNALSMWHKKSSYNESLVSLCIHYYS